MKFTRKRRPVRRCNEATRGSSCADRIEVARHDLELINKRAEERRNADANN